MHFFEVGVSFCAYGFIQSFLNVKECQRRKCNIIVIGVSVDEYMVMCMKLLST